MELISICNALTFLQIIAVYASDTDEGLNGTVVYNLVSATSEDHPFYLQKQGN